MTELSFGENVVLKLSFAAEEEKGNSTYSNRKLNLISQRIAKPPEFNLIVEVQSEITGQKEEEEVESMRAREKQSSSNRRRSR